MEKQYAGLSRFNLATKYEKRSLLTAVNLVAGLSIFFFGYDQGLMGGVNQARNYVSTMGFGHWDPELGILITRPWLQGAVVRFYTGSDMELVPNLHRTLYTTSPVHWSAVCWEAGSEIALAVYGPLPLVLVGPSLVPVCSVLLRTMTG